MSQLQHNISSDAYHEFLSDVATAVQEHRVQAIQSVQTISNNFIGQWVAEYSNVNKPALHLEYVKKKH